MKCLTFALLLLVVQASNGYAQNIRKERFLDGQMIIKGRILDGNLMPVHGVSICTAGYKILGTTDVEGYFDIEIPADIQTFMLGGLGYNWMKVTLHNHCSYLEVILLGVAPFYSHSHRKIDRLRKKRFKEIPNIHAEAYRIGLFKSKNACYERTFIPIKPALDKMKFPKAMDAYKDA